MTITQNNLPLLHRKEWQMMSPCPTTNAVGMTFIYDQTSQSNLAMYVCSTTVQYLYHFDEDAWTQIPSGALAGTFAAGVCGFYHPWSISYKASGGSTTTVDVLTSEYNLTGIIRGATIEFTSGANIGLRRTITQFLHAGGVAGTTITLTLDSAVTAVADEDTFKINTGKFYVLNAYTSLAAGVFKVFDVGTMTWQASLATTGLPAAWASDGRIASPARYGDVYDTATADIFGATTIGLSTRTWTADQWINYQVRISAGTGIGQVRHISDSSTTTLTVSAAWTTTPDDTSVFIIEGCEDHLFLLGNAAVTMYKYEISTNTWATVSPTTARTGTVGAGLSANHVGITGDVGWANINDIKDGAYIYSFNGGASSVLWRFKIAGGTAGAGSWEQLVYPNAIETFTTGTSYEVDTRYIYIKKDATNRIFKYAIRGNYMEPVSTDFYTDGTALVGNKMCVKYLDSAGTVKWLYYLRNSATELRRIMIY